VRLENSSQSPSHRYTPGPGAYELGSTLTKVSYSLAPRTTNFAERGSWLDVPGPGAYNNANVTNKTGQYFVSKFISSGATRINPAGAGAGRGRGISSGNNSPGPGRYEVPGISKDGNYFLSKHESSRARSFGKGATRSSLELKIQTPGPGSYMLPSDFGVYVSTNAPEASRSTRSFTSNTSKKSFRISSSTGALLKNKKILSVEGTPSQTPVPFLSTDSRTDGYSNTPVVGDNTHKTTFSDPSATKADVKKPKLEEVKEFSRFEDSHSMLKTPNNPGLNINQPNTPKEENVKPNPTLTNQSQVKNDDEN